MQRSIFRASTGYKTGVRMVLLASLAFVLAPATQASPQAESVVQLSPIGTIADQSRAMLKAGIRDGLAGTGQVDPFVAETIAGIGSSAFNAKRLRTRLVNSLDADLDAGELEAAEQWYRSDLGQKIAQAESDAAMPDAWQAVQSRGQELRKRFQGTPRQKLFARYDQALQASERTVDAAMAVQLSLAEALASLSETETTESVAAQILENRPQIEQQAQDQIYLAYLHMYEPLSEGELERYLTFLESPAGRAFTASASGAIHDAIMEPVSSLGGQVVRLLGTRRE